MTLIFVCLGSAFASQAPEFAQQYRQRLGGAIEELAQIVATFDADAARHQLNRQQALDIHAQAAEPFLQDRGVSTQTAIQRLENLYEQAQIFATLPSVIRPVAVVWKPDERLLDGTLKSFEPAIPLTAQGAVWTGAGGLLTYLLAWLFAFPFRRRRKTSLERFT